MTVLTVPRNMGLSAQMENARDVEDDKVQMSSHLC